MRLKALKMFKASIDGALPIMLNPGDVADVDVFTASMLIRSEKAELTDDKPFINKNYVAPTRVSQTDSGLGALMAVLSGIQNTLTTLQPAKAR
jgi:hypothetical protein